jgi:hypothetical protein
MADSDLREFTLEMLKHGSQFKNEARMCDENCARWGCFDQPVEMVWSLSAGAKVDSYRGKFPPNVDPAPQQSVTNCADDCRRTLENISRQQPLPHRSLVAAELPPRR